MATTPPDAPTRLPGELDFDAIVTGALGNPEIVAGAAEAGLPPEALRGDVSRDDAIAGVLSELAAVTALDNRLAAAHAESGPHSPDRGRSWTRAVGPHPGADLREQTPAGTQPELPTVQAEHKSAVERLATALSEQVMRQLRSAVERRTMDSYSTLLKVGDAPGLAQLIDDDYGVRTRATDELVALFGRMPGGSIGLAGRRGIGKSKLIQRLCPPPQAGREPPLLATVVSAPTQYDSREFILHLFARLCETVVGGPEVRTQLLRAREQAALRPPAREARAALLWRSRIPLLITGLALVCASALGVAADPLLIAGGVLVVTAVLVPRPWMYWGHGLPLLANPGLPLLLVGAVLVVGSLLDRGGDPLLDGGIMMAALALVLLMSPSPTFVDERRVKLASGVFSHELTTSAHARLDEIQYQRTIAAGWTSGASATVGAGPAEISGQTGVSGSRTLVQMPLPLPEIVERLRAFLRQVATSVEVRIGIDELDKIESEETAHRFLNEIKAVFGIPRCYFVVSVSEEAMANFDRRGARLRDVFDSSFDEILYVPPLTFAESVELLRQRVIGLPMPYHALCHVLSGGLPRDLIRVARAVIAAKPADENGQLADIAMALIALELEQRVRAVSVVVGGLQLEPKASSFLRWARALPSAVSVQGLLACSTRLEPFGHVDPAAAEADEPERSAHVQVSDVTVELMTFCYFAATVMEYFDAIVARKMDSTAGMEWTELEELTSARAASSANPRVGWGLITAFRMGQLMVPYALPELPSDPSDLH